MPEFTNYIKETPSWAELSTSDDQGALAFYGALFGWVDEANEIGPGMYYHMQMLMLPQIRLYHCRFNIRPICRHTGHRSVR